MYKEFYLMRKEPFDSHPSPELFYKSTVHQTAWHYLVQGIKQHEPILVLAGEYGAGKTLLFLKLIRLMEKQGRLPMVAVSSPTYSFVAVLEKVVEKLLNISTGSIDSVEESTLQQTVYEYFEKVENRSPIYIVIDDAQEFSYSFINKLRLFASYNCDGFFPIRLIFFAHHSFLKMLRYKKLVALGQRIKRIYYLKPLNFEETKEYIYYRLIHSGATGTPVFDDDAIAIIRDVTGGNPRLINNLCDNCLLAAGEERVNLIDPNLVYLAMDQGNLTSLKDVERPGHDPVVMPQAAGTMPSPPQGFSSTPGAAGVSYGGGANVPRYAQQEAHTQTPFQAPPAHPPHMQQPYENQVPQMPYAEPGQGGQMPARVDYPAGNAMDEPDQFKNKSIGLWEQYGKILMIAILALVIIFLASYLYNQYNANRMFSLNDMPGKRVIKQMPAYTIEEDAPGRQFRKAIGVQTENTAPKLNTLGEQRPNAFKPILLSGNLEG